MRKRIALVLAFVSALFVEATRSSPWPTTVEFEDPDGLYTEYYDRLTTNLAGGAMELGKHLQVHRRATLDILIRSKTFPRLTLGATDDPIFCGKKMVLRFGNQGLPMRYVGASIWIGLNRTA